MNRIKCTGCGRVLYEQTGNCPQCNRPLHFAEKGVPEIPPPRFDGVEGASFADVWSDAGTKRNKDPEDGGENPPLKDE